MKLGFISGILGNAPINEVIDIAHTLDYECVELSSWLRGSGCSHFDIDLLNKTEIEKINTYCKAKNITISALSYYPNYLEHDYKKRVTYIEHLEKLMDLAPLIGTNTISTFIGRNPHDSVEESLELYQAIWSPIIKKAEQSNIQISIENCPMYMVRDNWPGGRNLAMSPQIWNEMFRLIPSENLGITYDPSHLLALQMDYIKPLYNFKSKIHHIHLKDAKLDFGVTRDIGSMDYPIEYLRPKLPGLGQINWGKFISALYDIGYDHSVCVELKDNTILKSDEDNLKALKFSRHYFSKYIS